MTDIDLKDIRARHKAATGGTWLMDTDGSFCGDTHMVVGDRGDHADAIASMDFGEGDQAARDEAFVLGAHADIAALLGEIDRLHAIVDRVHAARDHIGRAHTDHTHIPGHNSAAYIDAYARTLGKINHALAPDAGQ